MDRRKNIENYFISDWNLFRIRLNLKSTEQEAPIQLKNVTKKVQSASSSIKKRFQFLFLEKGLC